MQWKAQIPRPESWCTRSLNIFTHTIKPNLYQVNQCYQKPLLNTSFTHTIKPNLYQVNQCYQKPLLNTSFTHTIKPNLYQVNQCYQKPLLNTSFTHTIKPNLYQVNQCYQKPLLSTSFSLLIVFVGGDPNFQIEFLLSTLQAMIWQPRLAHCVAERIYISSVPNPSSALFPPSTPV